MKAKIHPTYKKAKVKCACGNTFETISNVPPQGGRKHPEQQYLQ
ncbi:MAG: hypothetical protein D6785_10215, partial [Planctomycetota bacterium]